MPVIWEFVEGLTLGTKFQWGKLGRLPKSYHIRQIPCQDRGRGVLETGHAPLAPYPTREPASK